MTVPSYLTYYAVLGSIGIIVAVLVGLGRALAAASWPTGQRERAVGTAALILTTWLGVTGLLAWLGAYRGTPDRLPTIQFGILLPILIGVLVFWRSSTVSRIIDALPQQWLVGVQLYRVLGAVFVVLFAAGNLPGLFALPAGLGDLVVGLLAPMVAATYARRPDDRAGVVLAWNVLGIADLVVAVGIGFATAPSPVQLVAFNSPNVLIGAFPLVLIPVFLVPLSILLHLASLVKLRRVHASTNRPTHADMARA